MPAQRPKTAPLLRNTSCRSRLFVPRPCEHGIQFPVYLLAPNKQNHVFKIAHIGASRCHSSDVSSAGGFPVIRAIGWRGPAWLDMTPHSIDRGQSRVSPAGLRAQHTVLGLTVERFNSIRRGLGTEASSAAKIRNRTGLGYCE